MGLETQGTRGGSPLFPTSHHLPGILGRGTHSSIPNFRCVKGCGPWPRVVEGQGHGSGRPDGQVRRTKVTNDNVASPTVPVISQQPSVGKNTPLAWNPLDP